ncbi:uncharacterized protein Z520_05510 [Fonsecaea multimorphosa CBS 102226]|uniref:Uracil permease n=1 Tax=Fonsecaea multimorphosa CBS 102226 TaxID=1442371 RepID=A0A0D2K7A6_9EURO|nr:uncharacterized protein Z520_05510 [Fonsecaea multimorphosa CBS 102226]KIX99049.1 hypothetical protein Z520_05510 [Fonsecaea multimorphosa CBS 102226]OAL25314.1 hypothetical protein AYO22_05191 [Fonsecaea multimorphosa]
MGRLSALVDKLSLRDEHGQIVSAFYNEDIRPLPPSRRTWTGLTYFSYQCSVGVIIALWSLGSSLLAFGLNAWQCIILVICGYAVVGVLTAVGSEVGGRWHINFPVASRASWGIRGSVFPVLNRTVLNITWFSIESWFGSMCVKVTIGALWPSFYNMKNTFSTSLPMETNDFVAWFIFTFFCMFGVLVRPEVFHWPAVVTSCSMFITSLAMMAWFVNKVGGPGPLFKSTTALTGVEPSTGPHLAWMAVRGFSTVIASQATGVIGYADWGRFAKTTNAQRFPQALGMALADSYVAIIGIICASCGAALYPEAGLLWNPAVLLTQIQQHGPPSTRAAVFFASIPLLASQFLITVTGAAVAGGIDLAGIVPKFLDLRRGAWVVCIVGILAQPWQLANTSTKYVAVMGSYSIFLAPLTGILHCDYYLVRKQRLSLRDLYTPSATSSYWFFHGVNWRAAVSFCIGFFSFVPGFVHTVTPSIKVSAGWSHIFYLSYPVGYLGTAAVYYTLNHFFPPDELGKVDEYDYYQTFTPSEKPPFGIIMGLPPASNATSEQNLQSKKTEEVVEARLV